MGLNHIGVSPARAATQTARAARTRGVTRGRALQALWARRRPRATSGQLVRALKGRALQRPPQARMVSMRRGSNHFFAQKSNIFQVR